MKTIFSSGPGLFAIHASPHGDGRRQVSMLRLEVYELDEGEDAKFESIFLKFKQPQEADTRYILVNELMLLHDAICPNMEILDNEAERLRDE